MNYETSIRPEESAYTAGTDANAGRRRALLIGALVLVAALLAAFFMFRGGEPAPGAGDAAAKAAANAPQVTVVVPGRQPVARTVSATGSLAARREMPVGVVGEGGMVTRVLVEPGTWVGAGQVLAVVERSVQSQQAASLQAQIGVARANARLAEQELARAQQLVSRGFISKADVDRRIATRDQTLAQVRVAEAQYRESLNRNARLDIRAPAAGLVLTRSVEPGQVIGGASGTLFRIAMGGQMEMRAELAEADLATVRLGSQASVVPVGSTRTFAGQVWQVAPVIDPQTRQGIVRVALAYDPALRPGGFAQAQIVTGQVDAPVLPESAVQSDDRGNYVYVVGPDNKAQRRVVKTGQVTDAGVVILDGLQGNEQVVLTAGAFLTPGQAVRPSRAAAPR
ncbi:efflux RND transporter periplasmic adaptor subunit [Sphingomonas sp.]|jgi:RND family efflux transporter MFP subunit|uniref:efflux RND transporter periplasmic adaptor subunit n=1 Tax=Sphingomonas sp. TaxID=28214 RepID=UPI002DF22F0B|nr:efflux RND transporter periplasmic adaptor subunit [Sphingomonas sp.]HEV2568433.1 efflux RND transporter periplasmic adaptor subunit [Sphingomonas sp.]